MAAFGQIPAYLMLVGLATYSIALVTKFFIKKPAGILLLIASAVVVFVGAYYLGNDICNENGFNIIDKTWSLGLPVGFLMLSPGMVLGFIFGRKATNPSLWKIAFFIMLFLGICIGFVTLVKLIPHRPRFRLLTENSTISFHNWWEICKDYKNYVSLGIAKEEFKSMPSGHISMTISIINFIFIPKLLEKEVSKKTQVIIYYCSLFYVLLLGYSRINIGAHFLSDVSIASIIGLSIHYICALIINKEYKN